VLVFDLADRGSFDRGAPHWLRECERQCPEVGARLLIGNKVIPSHPTPSHLMASHLIPSHLRWTWSTLLTHLPSPPQVDKEHREVSVEEARSFAHSMEADYIETSCKDSTNVVDAFDALARLCRQQIGATEPAQNLEIGYALVPFAPRELLTDPLASDSVLAEQRSSGCSGGC
jgi:GTPase SAR1 family protein